MSEAKEHEQAGVVSKADVPSLETTSDPRRPYTTPKLRHLGSVRDLTLTGSAGGADASGHAHA